jgi:hypothetical protein
MTATLVILTAEGCGYCADLERKWQTGHRTGGKSFEALIRDMGVNIERVKLRGMGEADRPKGLPGLLPLCKFFPNIFLCATEDWQAVRTNHRALDNVWVMNGEKRDGEWHTAQSAVVNRGDWGEIKDWLIQGLMRIPSIPRPPVERRAAPESNLSVSGPGTYRPPPYRRHR